jgi:uncharacterized protein (TIGR03435 family)
VKLAVVLCALAAWAQGPAFEVASVKPSGANMTGPLGGGFTPDGGVQIKGMPLRSIIVWAYDVQDFQLSGGPGWINAERYDIVAKAPGEAASAQVTAEERRLAHLRLQALLAERFGLVVLRGTKDASVYALVVGRNGAKFKEGTGERQGISQSKAGELEGHAASMEILATVLGRLIGRPVIDKTGLPGRYDFKLAFAAEMRGSGFEKPGAMPEKSDPTEAPSIFTAVQEQTRSAAGIADGAGGGDYDRAGGTAN